MNALISGANGFTSSYLAKNLIKKGYKVRGLVRKNSNMNLIQNLDIELVFGDLADNSALDEAVKDIDIVFHIAAAYRTPSPGTDHALGIG